MSFFFFTVEQQERAIVERFGKFVRGGGGCFKRPGRHEGFERQHFGYQHTPCARGQQLADAKARAVEDVAAS